jgi:hypothetical protein
MTKMLADDGTLSSAQGKAKDKILKDVHRP